MLPFKVVSTDFDGTLHADHEDPPVPRDLQLMLKRLQECGVKWIINTGRDLSSLMEAIGRARLSIIPDHVVVVEREIFDRVEGRFVRAEPWNSNCQRDHASVFEQLRPRLPGAVEAVHRKFTATIYEDPYSPFCLIAKDNPDADRITDFLEELFADIPGLSVVRNDVYMRTSHAAYTKGTALQELCRRHGVPPEQVVAAGDHFNDLPMLRAEVARCLIAPVNAVPPVQAVVLAQGGYVSHQPWGHGLARGLEHWLGSSAVLLLDRGR